MNGLLTDYWPTARQCVFGHFERGELNIRFDDQKFTGLDGAFDAVERLLSGASIGKVIVDLRA